MCAGQAMLHALRQGQVHRADGEPGRAVLAREPAGDDIDLGVADETGHVPIGRFVIELLRLGDLPHLAFQQHTDGIRQRQSLGVVGRREDEGAPELALQAFQLGS